MKSRFHLFTLVHKGLRHALQELVWTGGKLDVTDRAARTKYFETFERVAAMLHQHAKDEDEYIQPLIDRCAPEIGRELEAQHQRSDELLIAVERTAQELKEAESVPAPVWQSFLDELNRFVGDYYLHLYHEEAVAMPKLWEAFDDQELMAVGLKLRSNVPPHIQSTFQRYMIPALNVHEQANMLAIVRQGAPEPAFRELCRLYESLLPPREWEHVKASVGIA